MFLHMVCLWEINTDQLNEKSKGYLFEHNKEVGHDHLCLARLKGKQRTEKAKFGNRKERASFTCAPD